MRVYVKSKCEVCDWGKGRGGRVSACRRERENARARVHEHKHTHIHIHTLRQVRLTRCLVRDSSCNIDHFVVQLI